jgi:hypothetical protein
VSTDICAFGGVQRSQMVSEREHLSRLTFDREIWFDRDIDGRWLVWAGDVSNDPSRVGAIVVRDPHAIAFIEMLAELIVDPTRFHDEPTFGGAEHDLAP